MDSRTRTRVEEWESRPFGGGSDELESLAEMEFSGALTAAGIWIFVLNGRVVGTVGGGPEDVVGVSGTVYEAPEDVLPLLAAMLESDGESKGTYYTNETPLTEVDHTLQQGSFTGYVELAEQVLSGDYYAVYYGGRRMSAAYIGNAERLLTGEDAFERAADEVGIYEVIEVDVPVQDLSTSGRPTGALDEESASSTGGVAAGDDADGTSGRDERAGDIDEMSSDSGERVDGDGFSGGDGIHEDDVEPVDDDVATADVAADAASVAGSEATDVDAEPIEVVLTGKNSCLGCDLSGEHDAESDCAGYGCGHALTVEAATTADGEEIANLIGRVIHYLPNDTSAPLIEDEDFHGEDVEVEGRLFANSSTLEVADFTSPDGE